jgi:hypothetical protein
MIAQLNPMAPVYSLDIVMLILSAGAAIKIADFEDGRPLVWAAASVAAYMATWQWLGWPWYFSLLGQLGLVGVVTIVRTLRPPRE